MTAYVASIGDITSAIGSLFGIGGALAAVVFGLLAARNKVTIQSLENTVGALQSEVSAKDLVINTRNDTINEKDKQIILLSQKSDVLQNVVTQAPEISRLALQIGKQHKESQQALTLMTEKLGDIATALGAAEMHRRKDK